MNAAQLTIEVKTLQERLAATTQLIETTNQALDEVRAEHKKLQQEHNDHRRETEKEIAVLKREVDELKKSKDLWGNRVFMIVMCFVSALIGGIVTNFIKKP